MSLGELQEIVSSGAMLKLVQLGGDFRGAEFYAEDGGCFGWTL